MRSRVAVFWLALVILGLAFAAQVEAGSRLSDVTVDQARELLRARSGKSNFVILDVRTPEEFAEGRLAGAVNVNLLAQDFETRLGQFDRSKTYLVYCRTGNRSTRAIQIMKRLGFQSVLHMADGIVVWQKRGFPLAKSS